MNKYKDILLRLRDDNSIGYQQGLISIENWNKAYDEIIDIIRDKCKEQGEDYVAINIPHILKRSKNTKNQRTYDNLIEELTSEHIFYDTNVILNLEKMDLIISKYIKPVNLKHSHAYFDTVGICEILELVNNIHSLGVFTNIFDDPYTKKRIDIGFKVRNNNSDSIVFAKDLIYTTDINLSKLEQDVSGIIVNNKFKPFVNINFEEGIAFISENERYSFFDDNIGNIENSLDATKIRDIELITLKPEDVIYNSNMLVTQHDNDIVIVRNYINNGVKCSDVLFTEPIGDDLLKAIERVLDTRSYETITKGGGFTSFTIDTDLFFSDNNFNGSLGTFEEILVKDAELNKDKWEPSLYTPAKLFS